MKIVRSLLGFSSKKPIGSASRVLFKFYSLINVYLCHKIFNKINKQKLHVLLFKIILKKKKINIIIN